jgi:hypothetical protein
MIRLSTALLTLGVGMAIATTVNAQGWWVGCNPDAPACRVLNGSDDVRTQWPPAYVAPTHYRSMYMYAPRHSTHLRRTGANGAAPSLS